MTNRQVWEARILAMSDEDFAALIDSGKMQNEYGFRLCAWCKATHDPLPCANDADCDMSDVEYLRGEAIA